MKKYHVKVLLPFSGMRAGERLLVSEDVYEAYSKYLEVLQVVDPEKVKPKKSSKSVTNGPSVDRLNES